MAIHVAVRRLTLNGTHYVTRAHSLLCTPQSGTTGTMISPRMVVLLWSHPIEDQMISAQSALVPLHTLAFFLLFSLSFSLSSCIIAVFASTTTTGTAPHCDHAVCSVPLDDRRRTGAKEATHPQQAELRSPSTVCISNPNRVFFPLLAIFAFVFPLT